VGAGWTETVLHSFANTPDGALPFTGLIMDPAGNLYGTTYLGGSYNNGTVFELSPSGGDWTEKVIYDIGSNGAGLTMDAAGNIFGVTNLSTVFELSANGNGGWNPIALYTFGCTRNGKFPKGACPQGTPVLDKSGNIYGTTTTGGAKGCGTVYELSPGAKGKWTEKVLHSFNNNGKDGYDPWAGIVFDAAGNIYGTTLQGGGWNAGTVFELVAPVGDRIHYTEKVLWNFNGTDGSEPYGRLVLDSAGNLYGTTIYGGPYFPGEYGVVFELTP
jgi:uncharacterized repeat protein (TIGR03803 family)